MDERAVLLDLADFPQRATIQLSYMDVVCEQRLTVRGESVRLADCKAVWWRRPQGFVPHAEIERASHRQFVSNESQEAFAGLWEGLDALWVNAPRRDLRAGRKAYQLRLAQQLGLRIPGTVITNEPGEALAFIRERGPDRVIYKAFTATQEEWRETRLLRADALDHLDHVRYAPVIFQEYVDADVDVRVTMVGERAFAAAIHSQESAYKVDFRMDWRNTRVDALALPDEVERLLRTLMTELGLVYGAIDMRRTPAGEYVFLEVNPAGQWLFIEERTGQPITQTLADVLAHGPSPARARRRARARRG
jgi:glutathione synthase/RimK-type ligase-like ATP-grasp enzyme